MGGDSDTPLDVAELERLLRAADPAVRLVPSRVLRRVIKYDCNLPGVGLQVPHRKSYVVGRAACCRIVARAELRTTANDDLPDPIILLTRPTPERLRSQPRQAVLLKYWRVLFHASIHRALEARFHEQPLSEPELRGRLRRLGQTRVEEIRTVISQEKFLLPPGDDLGLYVEFAAVYLELRYFARHLLPVYFPSIDRCEEIDHLLAADVNAEELFQHCRPQGAPNPPSQERGSNGSVHPAMHGGPRHAHVAGEPSEPERMGLLARAREAASRGNLVRSIISRVRAERLLGDGTEREFSPAVKADLVRLVERLRHALHLKEVEAEKWLRLLPALCDRAARGRWPVEARLLYDLQKACLDEEQDVYALDLVEWFVTFGRRPIKRLLPHEGLVLQVKHLRGAAHRLQAAELSEAEHRELDALLQSAIHRAEKHVREVLRPRLTAVFDEVGLRPQNVPEQVARAKLVEELLDRVVERGHLNMGDLRDAVSRNDLKLADLRGPGEAILGDPLIQANRKLAVALDGIYHRGEIYLRWLQRLSALMFGTQVGRWLTLFLILPFGGAFVALVGIEHPLDFIVENTGGGPIHLLPTFRDAFPPTAATERHVAALGGGMAVARITEGLEGAPEARQEMLLRVGSLGLFLFFLINSATFRRWVVRALGAIGHGLHWLFVGLPHALRDFPPVRAVIESRPFRFFVRCLFRPLLPAVLTALLLLLAGDDLLRSLPYDVVVFVVAFLLINSRLGRQLEEALIDRLVHLWRRIRLDLIPGLFRAVLAFFTRVLEGVERVRYTVDEWLRFRAGDSRLALVLKTAIGFVWFWVMYVVRFSVNILIEPQINPIKHFPVVTVSHKLVLVFFVPPFARFLAAARDLPHDRALALATAIGFAIPGLFGFLAWELKENWRLYQANRRRRLGPVPVGHHGETVVRLLRPGIHSGTVPKLHARRRKALRRGNGAGFRKYTGELHHVAEAVRHFFERDFLHLLKESRGWGKLPLEVGEPHLGTNRIRIGLRCPTLGGPDVILTLEQKAGWLLASVAEPGWLSKLGSRPRRAFRAALVGFYKKSGVDMVVEQFEASFGPRLQDWMLTDEGLVIWARNGSELRAVYDLGEEGDLHPRATTGEHPERLPDLPAERVLFKQTPVEWDGWVDYWQQDQAGEISKELLDGVQVLPNQAAKPLCI